jgi:two-component system, NtrC family, sensor kinase
MSRDKELGRVTANLLALSVSLPDLIDRVRVQRSDVGKTEPTLPDGPKEQERLAAFAAYLAQYGVQSGGGSNLIETVDVQQIVDNAAALCRGEIAQKAGFGSSYLSSPLVRANARDLGQVVVSLLINAAQSLPFGAPQQHRVDIAVDTNEDGWARIAIADTGEGIAAEVLPYIFEPVYSTKRGAGMGIGLAIVNEIIQRMGGRISVETSRGFGTLFIVELPPAL